MKTTQRILALLTVGALGLSGVANANHTDSLNDLDDNPNNFVTIGDKIFDNFSISGFNPGDIEVTASVDPQGVYHLTFGGSLVNDGNDAFTDTQLFYRVRTTSGQPLIFAIDQSFNLTAAGNGGVIAIGETVRTVSFGGPVAAQSSVSYVFGVTDANDPPGEVVQGDQLVVNPPQAELWVTKDVFLNAAEGGFVGATIIDQSFHQVGVPDGGMTLVLLGAAVMGIGFIRRKLSA